MAAETTMLAAVITEPGEPDVLAIEERPTPVPDEGQVLISVAAAGVNRADIMQRRGKYPPPPGASDILGLEVSGVIARVGRGRRPLSRRRSGRGAGHRRRLRRILRRRRIGDLASAGAADAGGGRRRSGNDLHRLVQRLSARRPAARANGCWSMAASSGIGTTAIQLAKAFGAFVVATAGSDEKCRAAERLGADVAVNYRSADFVQAVKEATSGAGADVILDMVGGDYLARNIEAVAEEGRIVQISTLASASSSVDLRKVMGKRLTLTGSTLRNRPAAFKAELARTLEEVVWPVIAREPLQAGHRPALPAGGRRRGASAHGIERAYRQDHPDQLGLAAAGFSRTRRLYFLRRGLPANI